ncbi:hypothetical protein FRC17_003879 [Serendipita sp. 399]|nr:hypothetical protein FRC17_003879 [Serendipita sp. 399]
MYGTPAAPVAVPQTLTDTLAAPNRYTLQPLSLTPQRTNLQLPTIPELTMNLDRSTSPPTSNEHNDYGMSPPRAQQSPDEGPSSKGRTLSNSKRAEQNRRAQRAFRERRDAPPW